MTGRAPRTEGPRSIRRNVAALTALVWRAAPTLCVASLAIRLAAAAIPICLFWTSKLVIDSVVLASRSGSWPRDVWWVLGAQALLLVASDALTRATTATDTMLKDRVQRELGSRLLDHVHRLDLEMFANPAFHDRMERARNHAAVQLSALAILTQLLQQGTTLLSLIVGLALFSPLLVVLQIGMLVPLLVSEGRLARRWYQLLREQTPIRRQLDYLLEVGTRGVSAKELQLFGFGPHLTDRYRTVYDGLVVASDRMARDRALAGSSLHALSILVYSGGYAYLVWLALRSALGIGDLTFLGLTLQRVRAELQTLFTLFSRAADQVLLVNDLFELFEMQPRIAAPDAGTRRPAPRPIRRGFEFRDVSFVYAGSTRSILHRVSFHAVPGEMLAIVGENGAGKTTLIKLLTRLYDPTDGVILLDGVDLREYDPQDLRAQFSTVFQDFVQYELRAGENIGLGDVSSLDDRARVTRAARRAMAQPLIDLMPHGLDQVVGKRFPGSMDLSGGQWQRLALARACMRDPQVVILDEPTAALDMRAERELWTHARPFLAGRTVFLISHRLATVRLAQRILVLRDGQVAEVGTHDDLVNRDGLYAELFGLQAVGYR